MARTHENVVGGAEWCDSEYSGENTFLTSSKSSESNRKKGFLISSNEWEKSTKALSDINLAECAATIEIYGYRFQLCMTTEESENRSHINSICNGGAGQKGHLKGEQNQFSSFTSLVLSPNNLALKYFSSIFLLTFWGFTEVFAFLYKSI